MSGVAGHIYKKEEDAFENLLYFMAVRGMDSTGVATVAKNDSSIKVAKALGSPEFLIGIPAWNKAMARQLKVILGHNRFATKGEVKLYNAHPFMFENVVGMHNGTVYDYAKKKLPNGESFRTDSEAIISAIETEGVEKVIPLLDGAYALVWYDKRNDSINMIRNKERPLYYAYDEKHECLFWASEVELLASAMNRNNIKRAQNESKSVLLTPDTLMSWRLPESNRPFADPKRSTLKGYEWASSTNGKHVGRFSGGKSYSSGTSYYGDEYYPGAGGDDDKDSPFLGTSKITTTPSKIGKTSDSSDTLVSGITDEMDKRILVFPQSSKAGTLRSITEKADKGLEEIYKDDVTKIWFNSKTGEYRKLSWMSSTRQWVESTFKMKPDFLNIGKPPKGPFETKLFETPTLVIFKDKQKGEYTKYEFDSKHYAWHKNTYMTPPSELPYTEVDVNASHFFSHQGKKKKKRVYYKGWRGNLLSMSRFNEITKTGCVGCGRSPEWVPGQFGGKKVVFVSPTDFLCEYCGDEEGLVKSLMQKSA